VRRIYLLSALWNGLANLAFPLLARDFGSAFVLRLLCGAGLAGTYMPGMRLVVERFEAGQRGAAMGLYIACFSVGAALSLAVAPPVARSGRFAAIPATLGGAVRMNAGAHGHELSEVIEGVEVFRMLAGAPEAVEAAAAGFGYRRSGLPDDAVVTAARLRLRPRDRAEIRALMDEARAWRRRTQPLAEPNCGSVFKNPPSDHAARLLEAAGAKGMSVGGAAVSEKHANFIVAAPGTRAADVVALIRALQDLVASRFDVELEPEVHLVGDLDLPPR
jgi:hypothetical protein